LMFLAVVHFGRTGVLHRVSQRQLLRHEIEEQKALIGRVRWLIEEQRVRPEDILVLAKSWKRVFEIASAITEAKIQSLEGVHVAKDSKIRTDSFAEFAWQLGRFFRKKNSVASSSRMTEHPVS
jgi:ATP-dependent exoDNAse (exonuclease V) beta subunit